MTRPWREGYDYPSDDDAYEYDITEEADRVYEQQNDKRMKTRTITVGARVQFRGAWGRAPQKTATVLGIERTSSPSDKYGKSVESVDVDDTYILDLSDGHWCYSHQVDGVL